MALKRERESASRGGAVKAEEARFVVGIGFDCCVRGWNKSVCLACGLVVAEMTLGRCCGMLGT